MESLDPQTLQEWQEIFQLVDKDHGGSISKDELQELMDTLHIEVTDVFFVKNCLLLIPSVTQRINLGRFR